jgi:dimethylhistidine N-methyltransferase
MMFVAAQTDRFRLIIMPAEDEAAALAQDVASGLTASPKRLACRYFYDREGSRLFEAICALPEYYLTRAETAILRRHAAEIGGSVQRDVTVIELGSGNAVKTCLLLEALLRGGRPVRYVPIDICRPVLEQSAAALLARFQRLEIDAIAADYQDGLAQLENEPARSRLVLWLGSNIGNFGRAEATKFLRRIREKLRATDRVLVGVDGCKDRTVLEAAYDDAAGVTAQFNRNLLVRINRELGGDFDLSAFQHRAVYNEELGRIEMYLVSTRAQRVTIGRIGLEVEFAAGEAMHTENSYKYSLAEMEVVASAAGLQTERFWQDAESRFSVHLFGIKAE